MSQLISVDGGVSSRSVGVGVGDCEEEVAVFVFNDFVPVSVTFLVHFRGLPLLRRLVCVTASLAHQKSS